MCIIFHNLAHVLPKYRYTYVYKINNPEINT